MSELKNKLQEFANLICGLSEKDLKYFCDLLPSEARYRVCRVMNSKCNAKQPKSRKDSCLDGLLAVESLALSDNLQISIRAWLQDINLYFLSFPIAGAPYGHSLDRLTSIYWKYIDRKEQSEIETIRYRLDSLSLFLIAVEAGFRSESSWGSGKLQEFTSLIRSPLDRDHKPEEKARNVEHIISDGCQYYGWIACLGRIAKQNTGMIDEDSRPTSVSARACGYLILLPQQTGETSYTSRQLRKSQREKAVDHYWTIGIDTLAQDNGVLQLGWQIFTIQMQALRGQVLPSERAKQLYHRPGSRHQSAEATFMAGINVEDVFNRNTILSFVRPYESAIFVSIQSGNMTTIRRLLESAQASIHDVDPYGLGLLYYAAYYCWKAHGAAIAMQACKSLIAMGANINWEDDIGNTPIETMLDSALVYTAMSGGSTTDFARCCEEIGGLFNRGLSEVGSEYLCTRGFTPLHQVLLGINKTISLEDFLSTEAQFGNQDGWIDVKDSHHRTPLTWAAEFGWSKAVEILVRYGADPNQQTSSLRGHSTILHLAVAGPPSQFLRVDFHDVVRILLNAGVDANAEDHEGWTPLHIAASWGIYNLKDLFSHGTLNWDALTYKSESVNDLSPLRQFTDIVPALSVFDKS